MPIYQYACENCGYQKEALQKISDPVLVDCDACNKPTLRKQVTAAAFRLKGTGWYETDFKNNDKQATKKDSAPKGGSKNSETVSTTKPTETSA